MIVWLILMIRWKKKQKDIYPFFTRGRHQGSAVHCLSQHVFELPLKIREQ